jgi:UDP-N-acetylmuramoylalanine--D-glutamate ligase
LIAGGTDKDLNFVEFAKKIPEKTKKVILLKGNATEKILDIMKKNAVADFMESVEVVDSMERAVLLASESAEDGDVVLLSPGAASFGLFLNEFDRGDKFKEAVQKLK